MRITPITPQPDTARSTRHINDARRLAHVLALLEQVSEGLDDDGGACYVGVESGCHACGERV